MNNSANATYTNYTGIVMYRSSYRLLATIIVCSSILAVLFIQRVWKIYKKHTLPGNNNNDVVNNNNNNNNSNNNDNHNGVSSIIKKIIALQRALREQLSLNDRIELYHNKILFNANDSNITGKEEDKESITIESSSLVDIELGGNDGGEDEVNDDEVDVDVHKDDVAGDSDTTNLITIKRLCLDQKKEKQEQMINNGTCIICFEDFDNFGKGDDGNNNANSNDIVLSGDKDCCHHIYHKECMAQYLAINNENTAHHNKQRGILDGHGGNICPKCHHSNHCGIVCGEDVLQLFNNATTTSVDTSS